MKTSLGAFVIGLGLAGAALAAHAQATPVGTWKTIDDETKKEKSLVRISESNGVLSGRVEKLLDPTAPPDPVCKDCTDERKDKPIQGMTILRNVKQDAGDKALWSGGDILDPSNGKVYRVRLKPIDNGARLEVRGYIGAPMFGRTQTWIRVE
ncbi:DUF2147 domain-containing protein [Piscinibacter koreensis]|uniref:DUF2147 domain-containing protein n=1 Tax=Piscinibacter koreensis TaxID=2742824 RepID=A0A7Y6NP38_9BURK|nr:DUF2147 domain-containing protein [Schlegelella koreensis]NUZ06699.1 DUF2147 domain-containing protein [Schlegelella koreensis]